MKLFPFSVFPCDSMAKLCALWSEIFAKKAKTFILQARDKAAKVCQEWLSKQHACFALASERLCVFLASLRLCMHCFLLVGAKLWAVFLFGLDHAAH
jgi:hypothetical protein